MQKQILSLLKEHHALTDGQLFQHLNLTDTDSFNNLEVLDALGELFSNGEIEVLKDSTDTQNVYRIKRELQ